MQKLLGKMTLQFLSESNLRFPPNSDELLDGIIFPDSTAVQLCIIYYIQPLGSIKPSKESTTHPANSVLIFTAELENFEPDKTPETKMPLDKVSDYLVNFCPPMWLTVSEDTYTLHQDEQELNHLSDFKDYTLNFYKSEVVYILPVLFLITETIFLTQGSASILGQSPQICTIHQKWVAYWNLDVIVLKMYPTILLEVSDEGMTHV